MQHQPEQKCSSPPRLLPFPGDKTKQNKRPPAGMGGWMDGWMIWDLGFFAFLHLNEKE